MENPFYITGIIPEPYFCDRKKETAWMVHTLGNRAHILLASPTDSWRCGYAEPIERGQRLCRMTTKTMEAYSHKALKGRKNIGGGGNPR